MKSIASELASALPISLILFHQMEIIGEFLEIIVFNTKTPCITIREKVPIVLKVRRD